MAASTELSFSIQSSPGGIGLPEDGNPKILREVYALTYPVSEAERTSELAVTLRFGYARPASGDETGMRLEAQGALLEAE